MPLARRIGLSAFAAVRSALPRATPALAAALSMAAVGVITLSPQAAAVAATEPEQLARAMAGRLDATFQEWSSTLTATARSSAVRAAYRDPDPRPAVTQKVNALLTATHRAHPQLSAKIALLDTQGVEVFRAIKGVPASRAALSADDLERLAPAQTLAAPDGTVHQHGPYISPDARAWVISRATPITVDGQKVGVLYSEAPLEQLRARLSASVPRDARVRILDTSTDTVILDSAVTVPAPSPVDTLTTQWLPRVIPLERLTSAGDLSAHRLDIGFGWRIEAAVDTPAAGSARGVPWTLIGLLAAIAAAGSLIVRRSRSTHGPAEYADGRPRIPAQGSAGTAPSPASGPEAEHGTDQTQQTETAEQTEDRDAPTSGLTGRSVAATAVRPSRAALPVADAPPAEAEAPEAPGVVSAASEATNGAGHGIRRIGVADPSLPR